MDVICDTRGHSPLAHAEDGCKRPRPVKPRGLVAGLDEAEYHARPEFSQTQAKVLLDSPARYRWRLANPEPPRDVFDIGSAAHAKILGVGAPLWVIPAEDWKSPKVRAERDAARTYGYTPLLTAQAEQVDAMAEAVLRDQHARAALEAEGDVELSMFWTDPESGVECRGRVDKAAATEAGVSLVDVKTTQDGSPRGFATSAAKFGYRLQGGGYSDGWLACTGEEPAGFLFVTVEKEPPYLVGTYSLDPFDVEEGRARWREACARLADYRARDHWPAYAADLPPFSPLDLPAWAL